MPALGGGIYPCQSRRRKNRMPQTNKLSNKSYKWTLAALMTCGLIVSAVFPAFSQKPKKVKNETIEATAMGTGTQMGQVINISVEIYDYSTPEDKQALVQAFSTGQNQGLVNALTKMHSD